MPKEEQDRMPVEEVEVQDYFSRFEAQRSQGSEQLAAEAQAGLTRDQIQSIAATIKVL